MISVKKKSQFGLLLIQDFGLNIGCILQLILIHDLSEMDHPLDQLQWPVKLDFSGAFSLEAN